MFPPPNLKAALSVNEFCDALSIKRTTFYQCVRRRQINVVKVGTRSLIPVGEVQAFLERASAGKL